MPLTDAPLLDNWFPRATEVIQRGGNTNWATGLTGTVKTLTAYLPTTGTNKFYGVTDAGIYDITAGGAEGAVVQALTNGYWNSVMMTNSAGTSFLWGTNGVDGPFMYNGTTWSAPSITGVSDPIVNPFFYKHRLWFIGKNTMNLYYLPLDAVQGAGSQIPLGNIFRLGGYLVAGAGWSYSPYMGNTGEGSSEMLALITSEGQLAIYAGNDPTSASTWGLVGVWYVGKPVGNRCFIPLAGDLALMTESGLFPVSMLLRAGVVNFGTALSKKIQPAYIATTQAVPLTTQGFEGVVYPAYDALIMNTIPATGVTQQQFVYNTLTNAWSTFSNWPAKCFFVFQQQLYFGTAAGTVCKAWDAAGSIIADQGSDIVTSVNTAYHSFRSQIRKQVVLFRLLLAYSGSIDTRWAISPDFEIVGLNSFLPRSQSTLGAPWETSSWEVSDWALSTQRFNLWRSAAHKPGFMLSLWLQTAGNTGSLSWAGTDYVLEQGAIL
jgi:hypothetical protein